MLNTLNKNAIPSPPRDVKLCDCLTCNFWVGFEQRINSIWLGAYIGYNMGSVYYCISHKEDRKRAKTQLWGGTFCFSSLPRRKDVRSEGEREMNSTFLGKKQ